MIPAESSPSKLFMQLFVDNSAAERAKQAERVRQGRSIMDLVGEDARRLERELGNAANHSNQNMPVVLAGGGFRHGQHLGFDQRKNYPLPNLFVSLMQRVGLEDDRFATGTSTMSGLEMA